VKATGIVRRIDDLGRVVIPKEIRRTMRIREGDPLEIYTSKDGEVIFKKYSLMGDLDEMASQFCEALSKNTGLPAAICDRDSVIAASGGGKRELLEKRISPDVEKLLEDRKTYTHSKNERAVFVTDGNDRFFALVAAPILTEGDVMGCVLFIADGEDQRAGETEIKLAQTAAAFLGKHMET
jgi:AbrB family transcriptional regulator (stage V sporulation protein T)